jgi:hypothetical protein
MDLFWDVAASKHTPSQGSSERKPTTAKSTSSKADATKHSTLSNDNSKSTLSGPAAGTGIFTVSFVSCQMEEAPAY